MQEKVSRKTLDRRGFLGAGLGGAAVAATGVAAPATPAVAADSQVAKIKGRYQADSAHVLNFYRVNRY